MESDYDDKLKWGQELLIPRAHTTPRLLRDYISGWAGGGSGEPQAGKVGQWCLVFTMCPVSSVQCHTMTSCPRGEEGVQAGPVVTPVIMISLHSMSRYCVEWTVCNGTSACLQWMLKGVLWPLQLNNILPGSSRDSGRSTVAQCTMSEYSGRFSLQFTFIFQQISIVNTLLQQFNHHQLTDLSIFSCWYKANDL